MGGGAGNSSNIFFLTIAKLHKIPTAHLWNQLSAKQTAWTVFYVKTGKGKKRRNCGGCVSTSEALGAVKE